MTTARGRFLLATVLCAALSHGENEAQNDSFSMPSTVFSDDAALEETEELSTTGRRIIVMRPVNAYGMEELNDKWLLLLCESYFLFRLGGVPFFEPVRPAVLAEMLPGYAPYARPVPIENYMKAAKSISAPFILYTECEYSAIGSGGQLTFGQELRLTIQCMKSDDGSAVVTLSKRTSLRKLEQVLNGFMAALLDTLQVPADKRNADFLKRPVLTARKQSFRQAGEALERLYQSTGETWGKHLKDFRIVINNNPDMTAGLYAGMLICAEKKEFDAAAKFAHDIVNELREKYPQSFLHAVRYYVDAYNCEAAGRVADLSDRLNVPVEGIEVEMGRCGE